MLTYINAVYSSKKKKETLVQYVSQKLRDCYMHVYRQIQASFLETVNVLNFSIFILMLLNSYTIPQWYMICTN
jgi:hypothetical protein